MVNRYQTPPQDITLHEVQEGIDGGMFEGKPELLNQALKLAVRNTYREEGIPEGEIPTATEIGREAAMRQSQLMGRSGLGGLEKQQTDPTAIPSFVNALTAHVQNLPTDRRPAGWVENPDGTVSFDPSTTPAGTATVASARREMNLPGAGMGLSTDRFYNFGAGSTGPGITEAQQEQGMSPPQTLASGAPPPANLRTPQELSAAWTSRQLLPMDYFEELAWNFYLDGDVNIENAYRKSLKALQLLRIDPVSPYKYDPSIHGGDTIYDTGGDYRQGDTLARLKAQQSAEETGQYLIPTGGDPRTATDFALGISEEQSKRILSGDPRYTGKPSAEGFLHPSAPRTKIPEYTRWQGWLNPIIEGMGPMSNLYRNYLQNLYTPLQRQFSLGQAVGQYPTIEGPEQFTTSPFEEFLPTARRLTSQQEQAALRKAVTEGPDFLTSLKESVSLDDPGSEFDYAWQSVAPTIAGSFRDTAKLRAFRDYQTWKSLNPESSFMRGFVKDFSFSPTSAFPRAYRGEPET